MGKTKVYVYIKSKDNNPSNNLGPTGVIKTAPDGTIIAQPQQPKEEKKEVDLKELVEKTVQKELKEQKNQPPKNISLTSERMERYFEFLKNTKLLDETKIVFSYTNLKFDKIDYSIDGIKYNEEKNENQKILDKIISDPNLDKNNPHAVLEAALFVAVDGLETVVLAKLIKKSEKETNELLKQLQEKYNKNTDSAIEIQNELKNKWVMRVKQPYAIVARQFANEADISKHALKTLAFISKNENITKRELYKKLGSSVYEDIKELEEKGFILTIPYKRTKRIKLTPKFNQYFGL